MPPCSLFLCRSPANLEGIRECNPCIICSLPTPSKLYGENDMAASKDMAGGSSEELPHL